MIAMVAVIGAVPADARDSSYKHQQHVDGYHAGDPGVAGLSEFDNDYRRRGLKAEDLETEIVREKTMLTAAWLRLNFHDYMIHNSGLCWSAHNSYPIFQEVDCDAEKMRRVKIESGVEGKFTCTVWHGFNK